MNTKDDHLSPEEIEASRERRLEGMKLHEIEGSPLDAEQIAMFEMFEREGWSYERQEEYILERARARYARAVGG